MTSEKLRIKINQEFENIECSRKQFDDLLSDFAKQYLKEQFNVNYFADVLKRALQGNNDVKVEFDNEEDNINYVLDVCNNFKKELEKDYEKSDARNRRKNICGGVMQKA